MEVNRLLLRERPRCVNMALLRKSEVLRSDDNEEFGSETSMLSVARKGNAIALRVGCSV